MARPLGSCALHIDGAGLESHAVHGTVDYPLGCYEDDLRRAPVSPHWHDEFELLIVREGSARFRAGSRQLTLPEGDGLFVNVGVIHGATASGEGPSRLNTVVFHPRLVAGGTESVFWQDYVHRLSNDPSLPAVELGRKEPWQSACLDAARDAVDAFVRQGFGDEFRAREALSRVVCELCAHAEPCAPPANTRARRNDQRIKTMLCYVHEHFAENMSLEDIAASASVSVSECLRRFREATGTTPVQYVRAYRVRQAARLLETTDLSVAEVGAACGFRETSYFARTFRAVTGHSPREHRRLAAHGENS